MDRLLDVDCSMLEWWKRRPFMLTCRCEASSRSRKIMYSLPSLPVVLAFFTNIISSRTINYLKEGHLLSVRHLF